MVTSRDAVSVMCDAFTAPERRRLVSVLKEAETRLTLTDLAREVVRRERRDFDQVVDQEHVERVRIALHHTHLPKLEDAGIVEYDRSERRVALATSVPLDAWAIPKPSEAPY